ncbi:MAG: hypothetical protein ACLFVO_20530 [Chloroflexaceae bacterium]
MYLHTRQPFHIFQDIKDIAWGQPFEQRIDTALATITFFLPILTPSFFGVRSAGLSWSSSWRVRPAWGAAT